jgi:hypothetical protein
VAASKLKALGMVIFNVILSAEKNLKKLINHHSSLIIYLAPTPACHAEASAKADGGGFFVLFTHPCAGGQSFLSFLRKQESIFDFYIVFLHFSF